MAATDQDNAASNSRLDIFSGHLGHLSESQQEALSTFKDNLNKAKLYTPPAGDSKPSHDEPTLLRFLRARGFNPTAAQKQFSDAETWRQKHDVERLYATFEPAELEHAKKFYPRWTGRRDKSGRPLFVYQISALVPIHNELSVVPSERRYQRIIALYEHMALFNFQLCSHLPHASSPTPISSTISIVDLSGVSFSSLWSLRNHLQEASKLATANYPETLGAIAVVNAPAFFPTIWSWIKGWFDERTTGKIYILGKDSGPKLRELIHSRDLPKAYGGELEWMFQDEPNLDEDAQKAIGQMPKGPAVFVDGEVRKPEAPASS